MRWRGSSRRRRRGDSWFEWRVVFVAVVISAVTAHAAQAQIAVHDVAVTARNAATAVAKDYLLRVQDEQHRKLRRMAQRLSLFTDLGKYAVEDTPRWRIHDLEEGGTFPFDARYLAGLNYCDLSGAAYVAVTQPVVAARELLQRQPLAMQRALTSRLATVDVADAAAIAATHDSGQVRYGGRRELSAIETLERDVIDPSNEQSATAVLDSVNRSGDTAEPARRCALSPNVTVYSYVAYAPMPSRVRACSIHA